MIIGQANLLSKLESYSLDTFPKATIFVGPTGSGKHTIINHIANDILNIPVVDITDKISLETILDIYVEPLAQLYIIDCNSITEANQNMLLKLLEEPSKNAYISLLISDINLLLPTIQNRCMVFPLSSYSIDELSTFIDDTLKDNTDILKYIKTPGNLKKINLKTFNATNDLCENILTKLGKANFANMLTIVDKINFTDEYDKIDFDLFINMLTTKTEKYYIDTNKNLYLIQYNILQQQNKLLINKKINKQLFLTNLLILLWEAARNAN